MNANWALNQSKIRKICKFHFTKIDKIGSFRQAKGTTVEGLLPSGVESSDLKQRHVTEVVEKIKQLITIAQHKRGKEEKKSLQNCKNCKTAL